jgi:hypothetical protein
LEGLKKITVECRIAAPSWLYILYTLIPFFQKLRRFLFVLHISDRTYYKVEVQKCSESSQGGRRIRSNETTFDVILVTQSL